MAVRPIDGNELLDIERLLDTDVVRQSKTASWLLDQVLHDIQVMPTLTPPNEPLSVLVNDEPDREYIDYICPRCKGIISQRRRGQRMETVYQCKYHDNCGQRMDWSNPQPYRRPPEAKDNNVPTNDPLTIEQLREMGGQPVYMPDTNCWALVTQNVFCPILTFPDGEKCSVYDWYEQVGPVYRCPPEVAP